MVPNHLLWRFSWYEVDKNTPQALLGGITKCLHKMTRSYINQGIIYLGLQLLETW